MREVLRFEPARVRPEPKAVLAGRGMPETLEPRHEALLLQSLELLEREAAPVGALQGLDAGEFARVLEGEGLNETPNPVARVYPRASALALFAATLGPGVSRRTQALFDAHDFALAYMLDAAASAAADRCAQLLQEAALERLEAPAAPGPLAALRYSPGYCGWHLSGQGRLFEALRPGDIGISLGRGFLMEPLKSVSGVILSGAPRIHAVEEFEFCGRCAHRGCRARAASVRSV